MDHNSSIQQMPHQIPLNPQVILIVLCGLDHKRHPVNNMNTAPGEGIHFFRVVCQETNVFYTKVLQDDGSHVVGALICFKAKLVVGINGVETFILEIVSL